MALPLRSLDIHQLQLRLPPVARRLPLLGIGAPLRMLESFGALDWTEVARSVDATVAAGDMFPSQFDVCGCANRTARSLHLRAGTSDVLRAATALPSAWLAV